MNRGLWTCEDRFKSSTTLHAETAFATAATFVLFLLFIVLVIVIIIVVSGNLVAVDHTPLFLLLVLVAKEPRRMRLHIGEERLNFHTITTVITAIVVIVIIAHRIPTRRLHFNPDGCRLRVVRAVLVRLSHVGQGTQRAAHASDP